MDRFLAKPAPPRAETVGVDLHLLRLGMFGIRSADRRAILPHPEPHHLGARKGARCKPQLEELLRGHLVLYGVARLHIQRRRREDEAASRRTLYDGERTTQGLGAIGNRQLPPDPPIESLD